MTTPQNETRVALREATAPSQVAIRHELTVGEVVAQVQKIQAVMDAVMKPDIHYGIVPGTSRKDADGKEQAKPTLLKAGAEKLCLVFRLDPEYEIVAKEEIRDAITFMVRCVLYHIPTGERIASGIGSCSSREEKYGYRKAARVCPDCGKPAIIKGKAEYGGGWLCFRKKDGCGAKFSDGDAAIEEQETGRIPNENVWDLHNTLLKMAEKRALVAAVLNGTAASDFFTQDVEDFVESEAGPVKPPPPSAPTKPEANGPVQAATPDQLRAIGAIARKAGQEIHAFVAATLGRALPTRPDPAGLPIPTLDGLTWAEAKRVIDTAQVATQAPLPGTQQRGRP